MDHDIRDYTLIVGGTYAVPYMERFVVCSCGELQEVYGKSLGYSPIAHRAITDHRLDVLEKEVHGS